MSDPVQARREYDARVAAYRLHILGGDPGEHREWNQLDPGRRIRWRGHYEDEVFGV